MSEIVPFTCLLKNSSKEVRKIYETFFSIKVSMVPDALFVLGFEKPLLVLKCTVFQINSPSRTL